MDLLGNLVRAIAAGKGFRRQESGGSTRVGLRHDGNIAWLMKRAGSNAWIVTGYEERPGEAPAGRADGATTQAAASLTRDGMGAVGKGIVPDAGGQGKTTFSRAQPPDDLS